MENKEQKIYNKIKEYYSEDNLTKITQRIIDAYKSKQYSYLIGISNLIDESIVKQNSNIQKLFSHLIMLYHPDRVNVYINDLKNFSELNKPDFEKYAHIIKVTENLDKIQFTQKEENIDYDIEYEYGYDDEDIDSIIGESDFEDTNSNEEKNLFEFDFISLMRYRNLGTINDELPSYYFEELEGELILPDSNLFDLSGLEKCTNIDIIDLSNNQIVDITPIAFLTQLKEINLSGNGIQDISVLDNLQNLKRIDISFNEIDDISSLFELQNFEYVNIIGNKISQRQIEIFKKKKIIFVY
jgi:Leucine-rich repeat (LRR) protein